MERFALLRSLSCSSMGGRRLLCRARSDRFFSHAHGKRRQRAHQLQQLRPNAIRWRWAVAAPAYPQLGRAFSFTTPRAVSTSPHPVSPDVNDGHDIADKLGFKKISEQVIDECKSTAILYKHLKTGAEVMSVSNDDENKVFGIVFRTPPWMADIARKAKTETLMKKGVKISET